MRRLSVQCLGAAALLVAAPAARAGEQVIAESIFDDGPEGWTIPVSAAWMPSVGNPGGGLFGAIAEPQNITPYVFAPAPFLGDWNSFDNAAGEIRFDFALFSLGQGQVFEISPINIVITGPGGVAVWIGPQLDGPAAYQTYIAPIDESLWTVTSGTWADLLSDVQSVRFQLELVSNGGPAEDTQALDNVRLVLITPPCPGEANNDQQVDLADLNLVLANFGTAGPDGDVNNDNAVDLADLNLVLANFGTDCSG